MPQRFLLLGRAFNETVFLGLDRGPWFYSPTEVILKYSRKMENDISSSYIYDGVYLLNLR